MKECILEIFLKDIATHQMEILNDTGVHRCLKFSRIDGSCDMHFYLATWPGHLAISGDMGTFVFNRLEDMFNFFRCKKEGELSIDSSYYAEKCEAEDTRTGGIRQFCSDQLKDAVQDRFDDHFEDPGSDEAKKCWEALEDEVLCAENSYDAHERSRNFEHEGFTLSDFWEAHIERKTFHFIWCLYAIAWGIRQYDDEKDKVKEEQ
jgi:hypothetical protein